MYLGNQPALSYTSFAKQGFTTSATTSYTLDNPVTNENELALFINFVRQEPATAYTASGTSLTLTSATSASDDMYCVFLGKAVQTVNPPSGSVGLSQLSATGTKDATTFLRGDNTFAVAGGTNTPAFKAHMSANQSFSSGSNFKVDFDTEVFDTDSAYDPSTNQRFTVPSGKAGKYYINGKIFFGDIASTDATQAIRVYKNGSQVAFGSRRTVGSTGRDGVVSVSDILDLSVGDYIEIYGYTNAGSGSLGSGNPYNVFEGYKLVE